MYKDVVRENLAEIIEDCRQRVVEGARSPTGALEGVDIAYQVLAGILGEPIGLVAERYVANLLDGMLADVDEIMIELQGYDVSVTVHFTGADGVSWKSPVFQGVTYEEALSAANVMVGRIQQKLGRCEAVPVTYRTPG